jgi:penicillin-binding protein-related factor A (putative recombinase)
MTNALEMHVRKVAWALHDHQLARLYKIPNDIKVNEGVIVHGEQTPCDFIGFTVTGRAILVECKMFQQPSLPVGAKGLKAHQLKALTECHKAGGIGLLVWQRGDELAVIDPDQVMAYSRGRKSIPWKAIPAMFTKSVVCPALEFFWPFVSRAPCP